MLLGLCYRDRKSGLEIGFKSKDKPKMMAHKVITHMIEQEEFTNKLKI